jgi:hypothetical protein
MPHKEKSRIGLLVFFPKGASPDFIIRTPVQVLVWLRLILAILQTPFFGLDILVLVLLRGKINLVLGLVIPNSSFEVMVN